jgi:hypothetical protein
MFFKNKKSVEQVQYTEEDRALNRFYSQVTICRVGLETLVIRTRSILNAIKIFNTGELSVRAKLDLDQHRTMLYDLMEDYDKAVKDYNSYLVEHKEDFCVHKDSQEIDVDAYKVVLDCCCR